MKYGEVPHISPIFFLDKSLAFWQNKVPEGKTLAGASNKKTKRRLT